MLLPLRIIQADLVVPLHLCPGAVFIVRFLLGLIQQLVQRIPHLHDDVQVAHGGATVSDLRNGDKKIMLQCHMRKIILF